MPSARDAREWTAHGGLRGIGDSLYTPFAGPDGDDHRLGRLPRPGALLRRRPAPSDALADQWHRRMVVADDGRAEAPRRGGDRRGARGRWRHGHSGVHPISSCSWSSACSRRSAARCSTRWRCPSSPTPSPTQGAGPGRRGMGSGGRHLHGPRAGDRRGPGHSAGWRSIFWINIPVGIVAIVLALRYIPESKAPQGQTDRPGGPGTRHPVLLSLPHLRHHRGAEPRLGLAADRGAFAVALASPARSAALRAAPRRAVDRPALLPVGPVRRGHRDRGGRLRHPGGSSS
jgi:hypothetical protein